MPPQAATEFIDLARRSGLVSHDQITSVLDDSDLSLDESGPIASKLVSAGLITTWQSEQLLSGRYNGFFIGRYKVLAKLGRGGMGSVFLAEHLEMGRKVAVKVLTGRLAEQPEYLDRFRQEARAAARVDHPNIVRAFDVGHEGNVHFLVMEYIAGSNLQELVEVDGKLDYRLAADYIRQAACGLAHVHAKGLIHRDIKPANLLVDQQRVVKIVDLGLARLEEEPATVADSDEQQILGTVDYLAPEQSFDSFNVGPVADIYSLGCSLYYLLTGRPPFPTGKVAERVLGHRNREPDNLFDLRPDAPAALVAVCQKMMAKRPDDRYQSADDVMNILQDWLDGKASRTLAMQARRSNKPPVKPTPSPTAKVYDDEDLSLAPLAEDAPKQAAPPAPAPSPPASSPAAQSTSQSATVDKSKSPTDAAAASEPPSLLDEELVGGGNAAPLFDAEFEKLVQEQAASAESPLGGPLGQSTLYSSSTQRANDNVPLWIFAVAGLALLGAVGLIVWIVSALSSG
jgi:serine/threonine-protein kinase